MKKLKPIFCSLVLMVTLSSCTSLVAVVAGGAAYAFKDDIKETISDLL